MSQLCVCSEKSFILHAGTFTRAFFFQCRGLILFLNLKPITLLCLLLRFVVAFDLWRSRNQCVRHYLLVGTAEFKAAGRINSFLINMCFKLCIVLDLAPSTGQ